MEDKEEIARLRKELEETRRRLFEAGKSAVLTRISAGIFHQLSQPVTAIHGFLKFMKKEMKEDDKFYKPVVLMEEQSVYLKEMLHDLSSIVRHKESHRENVSMNDAVRRTVKLLTDELRIRRVEWEMALVENLPFVQADSIELTQVFMNIAVNAMEALSVLPAGKQRFLKITSNFDALARKVNVVFEDSGPGIPKNAFKEIFEPFYSTKTQGAGIGLSICRDIIKSHGGEITVESEEGKGARFIVRLPAA